MSLSDKAQTAQIEDRREGRRAERRGQYFAFVCVLAVPLTGIGFAAVGGTAAGLSFSGFGLAAVVIAFVRGRG